MKGTAVVSLTSTHSAFITCQAPLKVLLYMLLLHFSSAPWVLTPFIHTETEAQRESVRAQHHTARWQAELKLSVQLQALLYHVLVPLGPPSGPGSAPT